MADTYVRDSAKNNFIAMTKEEILAAIAQAIESGTISDVDTGFVTTIREMNKQQGLKFWVGTTAEFNALETKENNCLYIKTDDTSPADINNAIANINTNINAMQENMNKIPVGKIGLYYGTQHSGSASDFAEFYGYGTWTVLGSYQTGEIPEAGIEYYIYFARRDT